MDVNKTSPGKDSASKSAGVSKRPAENPEVLPPRKLRYPSKLEDVSMRDEDGRTPLHRAAKNGDIFNMKKLIARGADTRLKDRQGYTPLHLALCNGKKKAADLLAKTDCKNDVEDRWGRTPLHWAASRGPLGVVRKLLAGGARTRVRDEDGMVPLELGMIVGSQARAELLAETDVGPDFPSRRLLHRAIKTRYAGVVAILLRKDFPPHVADEDGRFPIELAMRRRTNRHIPKMILSSMALKDVSVNWEELQLAPHEIRFCIEMSSQCAAELQFMKEARLPASSVTYHDLVTRHVSAVAPRLQSESLQDLVRRDSVQRNFPQYADIIFFRLRLAEERKAATVQCERLFAQVSPELPSLPVTCSDIVLRCLQNSDIKNFITTVQFPHQK